jgi:hypothetical protein
MQKALSAAISAGVARVRSTSATDTRSGSLKARAAAAVRSRERPHKMT